MVLCDVRHFVRQHGSQLGLIAGRDHQAVVDEHVAAEDGLRIHRRIAHHEELPAAAAIGGLRAELGSDALQVLGGFRVLDDRVLVAHLLGDHRPELVLVGPADCHGGGAAQIGEVASACAEGRIAPCRGLGRGHGGRRQQGRQQEERQ